MWKKKNNNMNISGKNDHMESGRKKNDHNYELPWKNDCMNCRGKMIV